MTVDIASMRAKLIAGDFAHLFVEDLGWDHNHQFLSVEVKDTTYTLLACAEKRGMVVFECRSGSDDTIPDAATRRKIDRQVAQLAREHIIIYTDAARNTQIWQWVRREPGRPERPQEIPLRAGEYGQRLLDTLRELVFPLELEEGVTLLHVTGRVRAAFDVDRVTKKFYELFKKQHDNFLSFIDGIEAQGDREWYASLMLNRLMFVYFIQKKGFLDDDPDYLRDRLKMVQARSGQGEFLSFYRYFLLRLFHEGLGQPISTHTSELDELIGRVPYLNGGLFDLHQLEATYPEIQIADDAFERVFEFFDEYQWRLDDRPLRDDREINPDVLGYIFEKYINQKQMGAYYTKEDITEYIGKNTIIPYLFDAARKNCAIAFRPDSALWALLREDPDRYIYPAVLKGVDRELPPEIAAGIDDVSQRGGWNRPADDDHALPTETWREHVARRQRCLEVRAKLRAGEVTDINDLITFNLDIRQFAQDAIEYCEGVDLLRAFYGAIRTVTVLDPTCGSGAFLFAALNILKPLYEACLGRMKDFLQDLERSEERHGPRKYSDFATTLDQVLKHPNRDYFILKSIILNNLYGVDIMEEAVEIAKLRLFLTLVAQVEDRDHVEPLPDIDFNIRAGNTLVGFTTHDEVRRAVLGDVQGKMDLAGDMARIDESAQIAASAFEQFRAQQDQHGGVIEPEHKHELRGRLGALEDELNRYLAHEYGVDPDNADSYRIWRTHHQPFHWWIEFYAIMTAGGFGIIIGNPPWKEYSAVRKIYSVRGYKTEHCGNLHNLCTERSLQLRSGEGWLSFIVQLPLTSSSRMAEARSMLRKSSSNLFVIPFDDRPGKLFEGLEHCRSTIFLSQGPGRSRLHQLAVTRYQRWPTVFRPYLLKTLEYIGVEHEPLHEGLLPKYATPRIESVFEKVALGKGLVAQTLSSRPTKYFIFYQEATQYWIKATVGLPFYAKNGQVGAPAHGRYLYFDFPEESYTVCALLNSSLFYAYFITYGDCFHLSNTLTSTFPMTVELSRDPSLVDLGTQLMDGLKAGTERTSIRTKDGDEIAYDEYYGRKCKPLIDAIDRLLGQRYGFTEEEFDSVVNYEIKYRVGQDLEGRIPTEAHGADSTR